MQIEEIQPAVAARLQIDAIRANGDHLFNINNTKARTGLSIHQSSKDMVVDCWKTTLNIKKQA